MSEENLADTHWCADGRQVQSNGTGLAVFDLASLQQSFNLTHAPLDRFSTLLKTLIESIESE